VIKVGKIPSLDEILKKTGLSNLDNTPQDHRPDMEDQDVTPPKNVEGHYNTYINRDEL